MDSLVPSRYNFQAPFDNGALLYNANTGALLRLEGPDGRLLSRLLTAPPQPLSASLPQSVASLLANGGFLVPDSTDEVDAVRKRYWQARDETPLVLTVTTTQDSGPGSLRQVVDDAPGGSVILMDPALANETIHLLSPILIDKSLVIDGGPMFSEITEDGVRWENGDTLAAHVILWCTGFRSSLDHLAPLLLREPNGGIVMTGRLATQVAKNPRVHLVGYGPSASTIGANRAGAAAATELMRFLGLG